MGFADSIEVLSGKFLCRSFPNPTIDIRNRGLTIGDPLDGFQGVLRGVPTYVGEGRPLLEEPVR